MIALNAPVGYLDEAAVGGRTCDRHARALLGPKRGSSIQSAPVRSPTNELEFLPDHLDAISMALLPRYREVAEEMAPFRQRTVYEVHSDVSFYELNDGHPLQWPKHTEKGHKERRTLLEAKFPAVDRILSAELPGASRWPISSTWPSSSGRPGGSSSVPPSAFPRIPSGTSRACAWRSSAEDFGRIHDDVKGRRSSGPAKTATAQPAARKTP